ncbi:Hypothetical predicted protein [Olea europaea subsp. europaea]|uniref:Uncharacterized protein n=1 Tax=Olea europaea subsp. europaea TaxID=158383 RepID=A0A8S0UZH2_OLEEU|nr:Hypothetical predicted protein [Olea europaea subsp. europaea]
MRPMRVVGPVARRKSQEPMTKETEGKDSEDHDSGDSDGDRVRRSGQTGTFFTLYVHRATTPMQAPSTSYALPTAMAGSSLTTEDTTEAFVDYAGHHPLRDGPDKDMGIDRYSTHLAMPGRSPRANAY